jgi:hypothetical protein
MPLPGRCLSAGSTVRNYGATNVEATQTNLPSRRRGGSISKPVNGLGKNKNLIMGPDGARNQERQLQFSGYGPGK